MDLVLLPLQLQDAGIPVFALSEPFAGKLRHQVGDAHIHALFGHTAHGEKHLIAPYDVGVVQTEYGDGQRKMLERIVLGILRVIGHRFDIGGQLFFPDAAGDQRKDQQHQDHTALGGSQEILLEIQRRRREEDHEKQMDPHAGLAQPLDALVILHRGASLR